MKQGTSASVAPSARSIGILSTGVIALVPRVFDERTHIGVYGYMMNGAMYSEIFSSKPIWAALVVSGKEPNPLYQIRNQVEMFAANFETSAYDDDKPPHSLDEVPHRFHALHQSVGMSTDDKDGVGWNKNHDGWCPDEDFGKDLLM